MGMRKIFHPYPISSPWGWRGWDGIGMENFLGIGMGMENSVGDHPFYNLGLVASSNRYNEPEINFVGHRL